MRVFITGGTGLIGRRLVSRLIERGDQPVVLSRQADRARLDPALKGVEVLQGDPGIAGGWEAGVDGCDAVIHLAGHSVFAERWTAETKRKIRDSRVFGTEHIVDAIHKAHQRPGVLVQASAIGYYGPHGDEELTEEGPAGSDFLANVCREWEDAAHAAEPLDVRVPIVRVGIVLARSGGALKTMLPIFKYLPGGAAPVGSGHSLLPATGQQWMSWIHIEDIVELFLLALDHPEARGPLNGTAPHPVTNKDFSRALARALRGRGVWPPFVPLGPPDALLRLVLGEVANIITEGQRVLPARAQALGYSFRFPELDAALRDLFGQGSTSTSSPAPGSSPAEVGSSG